MAAEFIVNDGQIEISSSKLKIFIVLLIGIAFVVGGVFFVLHPSKFQTGYRDLPIWAILALGYICITFFGAGVLIAIFQLFNNKPGLIIGDNGITINPGLFSTTFIEWDLIEKFDVVSIARTKLIMIYLKKPEEYIDNMSNVFKRKMALFNFNTNGTPLSISANTLKCNTDELCALLTERLKKH